MGYQIELYYGFVDGEGGPFHVFEVMDPKEPTEEGIAKALANALDTVESDENFDWDSMLLPLPNSIVQRIKADAIKDGKDAVEITSGTVSGKTGYHFDFGDHREFISLLDQRKAFARILELLDAGKDVKFINFTLGSLYREIQACQQNVIEEATKLLNKLTD